MAEPNWQRIEPEKHAWLRERNAENPDLAYRDKWKRYYVPESKGRRMWPMLVLTVLPCFRTREEREAGRHRVTVACSLKSNRDAWFEEGYGIPTALLDDVTEMFAKFIAEAKAG